MEIQHPAGDNSILSVPWVESTGRCGANNLPRLESYFSILYQWSVFVDNRSRLLKISQFCSPTMTHITVNIEKSRNSRCSS